MDGYGLPYQGSKNKIAEFIISKLPRAEHFYDLFAGGCAVTHCALLSGKYNYVHANDIQIKYPQLFYDAAHGKYRNENRVITRDEFLCSKIPMHWWSYVGRLGMEKLHIYGIRT